MALRKSDIPLQKHTLNLFEGEFERLKEIYGDSIDASRVVRELVHKHIAAVEKQLSEVKPAVGDLTLEDL